MKRKLEVTVSQAGAINIDAVGFKGPDCETATKFLEEALGTVGTKVKKPEYQQRNVTKHRQKVGG